MMRPRLRGRRRGSALILVLLMTLAVAALAIAAIFMSSSASLLSRYYDTERRFVYAAQSGIERVISRLQLDTTFAITSTTPVSALDLTTLATATDSSLAGVTVRVWAARTGDTTSTGPITITLLAQVADAGGTRYARRVDLRRLHYGQWAFVTNTATTSSSLPFANNSFVAGRVHANGNWSTITQASYRDSITSTGTVGVTNAGNLRMGRGQSQRRMPWPDAATLMARYVAAAPDTMRFDVSTATPARVEFVWLDTDSDGVADRDEGFVRVFDALSSGDQYYVDRLEVRAENFSGGNSEYLEWYDAVVQNQCGAFYQRNGVWQFFPVATHRQPWAWALISGAGVPGPPAAGNTYDAASVRAVLTRPTARCFPTGSPFLVNTERFTNDAGVIGTTGSFTRPFGVINTAHRYGGQDTTLTMTVRQCDINSAGTGCIGGSIYTVGNWRTLSSVPGRQSLRALDRNNRGAVLHFDTDIRLSGVVAGRVTLAAAGSVRIVDHLTYAGGENTPTSDCAHLLGVVAESYIRVEENAVSHRTRVGSSSGQSSQTILGGSNFFPLQGAFFSVDRYFGVEGNDFRQNNSNTSDCEGTAVSMGCIRHSGSAAMDSTRTFSTGASRGGRYALAPDPCMETRGLRPPLYPETNRYRVLRALDVRSSHVISETARNAYFASLQGISDIP